MGNAIVKIRDKYMLWSTSWDKPVGWAMTQQQFVDFYRVRHGNAAMGDWYGMGDFQRRMDRVEDTGCSMIAETLDEFIVANRAGPDETELTMDEIYEEYCTGDNVMPDDLARDIRRVAAAMSELQVWEVSDE